MYRRKFPTIMGHRFVHARGLSSVTSVLLAGAIGLGCGEAPSSSVEGDATPVSVEVGALTSTPVVDNVTGGTPISATVNAASSLAKFSPIAVGLNGAAWDGSLVADGTSTLVNDTGVQTLRYPGGSTSDNYHWVSNLPDDPNQGGTVPSAIPIRACRPVS